MNQRDPRLSPGSLLVVGKDVPRTDAVSKVTGNVLKRFSSDQTLPGRRPTTDAEASRGRGGSK